jgi:hypothetical protein
MNQLLILLILVVVGIVWGTTTPSSSAPTLHVEPEKAKVHGPHLEGELEEGEIPADQVAQLPEQQQEEEEEDNEPELATPSVPQELTRHHDFQLTFSFLNWDYGDQEWDADWKRFETRKFITPSAPVKLTKLLATGSQGAVFTVANNDQVLAKVRQAQGNCIIYDSFYEDVKREYEMIQEVGFGLEGDTLKFYVGPNGIEVALFLMKRAPGEPLDVMLLNEGLVGRREF